jgi:hypothetical protein
MARNLRRYLAGRLMRDWAPGLPEVMEAAKMAVGSVAGPGRAEQAGDLGYRPVAAGAGSSRAVAPWLALLRCRHVIFGRYWLAGAMVLACLSSSRARCSAAVALLCSQRSPLSSAHHCQARAWAIRFRAAASAGLLPQPGSWTEHVVGGIGVSSVPGSGRPACGFGVCGGMGVFSFAAVVAGRGSQEPIPQLATGLGQALSDAGACSLRRAVLD